MKWTDLPEFSTCPADWEVVPLARKAEFIAGQSPDSTYYNNREEGIPFLQGNAEFGKTYPSPTTYCTEPAKLCSAGDTLISVRAPVGAMNRADRVYGLGRGVGAVHPTDVDQDYLYYGMTRWHLPLHRAAQGSTFDAITARHFRQLRCCLPKSIEEQRGISTCLKLADAALATTEINLTAARRLKTALMQQLFTRGVSGRHADFQRTKWFEAPVVWKLRHLRQIANVEAGFAMGRDLSGYETQDVAYLTVVNVQEGGFDLTAIGRVTVKKSELNELLLRSGDILMTEGGDRDKLGRGGMWRGDVHPCVYQNHIFRVRFSPGTYKPALFHFLLQTWHAKNYFSAHAKQTSNLCSINSRELKHFPIFEPPSGEQDEMIELLSAADSQVNAVKAEIVALSQLKRSLLQNLLTGRVRVTI